MIYTITYNPAVDLVVESEIHPGELNRVSSEHYVVGGKGINVSQVVALWNEKTTATGFLGGFTGEFVKNALKELNIPSHFVQANGTTRVNVKVHSEEESLTELNMSGLEVTKSQSKELKDYLKKNLTEEDYCVISGIPAQGITIEEFLTYCKIAHDKGAKLVLDINTEYMLKALEYHPWLIKPRLMEMADVMNVSKLTEDERRVELGKKLRKQGASNVLLSNGKWGTILVSEDGVYYGEPWEEAIIDSVGSNDALVAGFVVQFKKTGDYLEAMKGALGSSYATINTHGFPSKKEIAQQVKEALVIKQEV